MEYKINDTKELLSYLSAFITKERKEKIDKILPQRTKYITAVLENIYQPHNASAVLRSAECLGILNVHIVENTNKYKVNPDVVLGANKWLNLFHYNEQNENNTISCIRQLKKDGYRIVATSPHQDDCLLEELNLDTKVALLFGTEKDGLSPSALDMADDYMRIPMVGFTESFNISVSAAICMHYLSSEIKKRGLNWQLSDDELLETKLSWYMKSIKSIEKHLRHFNELKKEGKI